MYSQLILDSNVTYAKIQDTTTANRVIGAATAGAVSEVQVVDDMTNFESTASAAGLTVKGDGTTDGYLALNCSQNTHGIKLKSPTHSDAQTYTLTFPGTAPAADKYFKTDASGNLSWVDINVGDIAWQAVTTAATLAATAGKGYPIDTTSNACTVTLPASASVGDQIIFTDYARNFATNALTINPNSLKYQGNTTPQPVYDTAGESIHIVYMDVTKGWIPINDGAVALETPQYSGDLYYLVVGGGGASETTASSSGYGRGGGGAGGYLSNQGGTAATLVDGNVYTVTVGAGGPAGANDGIASSITGTWGGSSANLSAAGGGYGTGTGQDGGSGSGGGYNANPGGSGNTPSTTPSQGNDGGDGTAAGGGGGGHTSAGTNGSGNNGGAGGAGTANDIVLAGTDVTYAGGGGGGGDTGPAAGGAGGGGAGGTSSGSGTLPVAGINGLGGGAGGVNYSGIPSATGKAGGDGIVVLRVPTADYSGTTTGSPTITTDGSDTVMKFLTDGSYTG